MLVGQVCRPVPIDRCLQVDICRQVSIGRCLQVGAYRQVPIGRSLQAGTYRQEPIGRCLQVVTYRPTNTGRPGPKYRGQLVKRSQCKGFILSITSQNYLSTLIISIKVITFLAFSILVSYLYRLDKQLGPIPNIQVYRVVYYRQLNSIYLISLIPYLQYRQIARS